VLIAMNVAGIMAENKADEIILDPKQIAHQYLRSWFVLDLISSLPLDYTITLFIPDAGSFSHLLHAGLLNRTCTPFTHYSLRLNLTVVCFTSFNSLSARCSTKAGGFMAKAPVQLLRKYNGRNTWRQRWNRVRIFDP